MRSRMTGVLEEFEVPWNIELALKFHPGKKRLVVIGDQSMTGVAIANQVRAQVPGLPSEIEVEFLDEFTLDELISKVRFASPDSIFFFIPFYKDVGEAVYSAQDLLEIVWRETSVPLYSAWEFLLGHGMVGGKMISGYSHGQAVAEMGLRILDGESPADIEISVSPDDPPKFDYRVLMRLGINQKLLPEGSILINQPSPFYSINRHQFWTIIISLVILSLVLILLVINIWERKQIEVRIKNQLSFLRTLMDTLPIPIYFTDRGGAIAGINRAFEHWFGVSWEHDKGFESQELALAETRFAPLLDMRMDSYEAQVRHGDGSLRSAVLHKATYADAQGENAGIVGVIYDISDRKAAELALAASEAMLQLVLDTIPQLVHWKDRELRIIGANRNFLAHVGQTELSAIYGRKYAEVVSYPHEVEQISRLDEAVVETDEPRFRLRLETRNRAGENMWLLVNKVPLHGPHGEVVGILSTAEDITQTMNLEKQLLQSQKMEAIGTLAGGIAHDFNNILTSIMNSTELAMEDIPEDSLNWKDLERSLKAAVRGSGLIKQILTFSRPTQEGFLPTDLREVVSEAVALIRVSMPRNITVLSEIDDDLPLCLADPTQVHQIVMNLATNAFQALGEGGGNISIRLSRMTLDRDDTQLGNLAPGIYSRLCIEDDGPGIDENIQDKIYDPFFTTKGKGEGTGLGLAVVHGIVRNHGGEIRLSSTPGFTRFDILLPTMNELCLLPGECAGALVMGNERLAFIEDDEDQLMLIPRVLEQLGYEVHPFQNPAEAIFAICDEGLPFDLVITDYDMPGMNGFDVAGILQERRPDLPVIMVSGRKQAEEFLGQAGNIKFFLGKPYNKDMVGRAIRDVLDKDA